VNIDYRITSLGAFTGFDFTVTGSRIGDGTKLLVSYSYTQNQRITFDTLQQTVNGSLSLAEGKYSLSASFTQTDQTLVSGEANTQSLTSSKVLNVIASMDIRNTHSSLTYEYSDSNLNSYQYVEGAFWSNHYFGWNTLNFLVRDRYTMYGATSFNNTGYDENLLVVNADFSRNLRRYGTLMARVSYSHSTSASTNRDEGSLEGRYHRIIGKFSMEAIVRGNLRDTNGNMLWDELFQLRLIRTF
jgi:hypothetical protein